jgi:hypothetical protein
VNAASATVCEKCGYKLAFDVSSPVAPAIKIPVITEEDSVRERLKVYLSLVKDSVVIIFAIVLLAIGVRLLSNWPFEDRYKRDARGLADALLRVEVRVETGVTLREYDAEMTDLSVELAGFKAWYEDTDKHLLDSYQNLVGAANFYQVARDAWSRFLGPGRMDDVQFNSLNAGDDATKKFKSAEDDIAKALKELR